MSKIKTDEPSLKGNRLSFLMKDKNLTMEQASRIFDIPKSIIAKWIKGSLRPDKATISRVACYFGMAGRDIWPNSDNHLAEVMEKDGMTVEQASKTFKINRYMVEEWMDGSAIPSREMMSKIANYFCMSVKGIWPDYDIPTNWKKRFASIVGRLNSMSYREEPEKYGRLCSELANASVKLYAVRRRAFVMEYEKQMYHKRCLVPSEFAQVTQLSKKPYI